VIVAGGFVPFDLSGTRTQETSLMICLFPATAHEVFCLLHVSAAATFGSLSVEIFPHHRRLFPNLSSRSAFLVSNV